MSAPLRRSPVDAPRMPIEPLPPDPQHYSMPWADGAAVDGRMSAELQLAGWWRAQAETEIEMVVAKAIEYGGAGASIDLIDIGRDLARIAGREVGDEEATELGIYFYLRGKLSRWTAAVMEGRRVSDDTLTDLGVYVRMAQRTREVGGWPSV